MADSIIDQLAQEAASGDVYNRKTIQPAIPTSDGSPGAMQRQLAAIKKILDTGSNGPALDQTLTLRDLINAGVIQVQLGGQQIGAPSQLLGKFGVPPINVVGVSPYLSTAPVPTNLTAAGTITTVFLTWDLIDFQNFAYTEVWRAASNSISAASKIGTALNRQFIDRGVTAGTTYYYWVRAIATLSDGTTQLGDFNAVSGVAGGPTLVGSTDLGDLVVTADKLSQGTYPNINLVPNPGAEDGTVAWSTIADNGAGTFTVDTGTKTGGLQSFRLTKTAATRAGVGCRAFPVIPGETYAWRVKVKSGAASAAGFYVRMQERTNKPASMYASQSAGPDVVDSTTDVVSDAALTTSFVQLNGTYTVPANRYWVTLCLLSDTTCSGTDIWWDDVSVGRQITAEFMAANSIAVGTAAIQALAVTNAMIANATIDHAKIASVDAATITVGQLTASQIDTRGLSIKDAAGNVILAAGNALSWDARFPIAYTTNLPANNATADVSLVVLTAGAGTGTIVGNTLTKTNAASAYDTSAHSKQAFTGGAFVEYEVTNPDMMVGLTSASDIASATYSGILYGIHCSTAGPNHIYAFESGTGTDLGVTWAVGDILAVQYDGTNVRYLKNGTVLRTISAAPQQLLYCKAAISTQNYTAKNIRFGPMTATTPGVTLVNGANMEIIGNAAKKVAGAFAWDASFYSKEAYTGGAVVTFTVASTNLSLMVGLNTDPTTDNSYTSLDYSIYLDTSGLVSVYESGTGASTALSYVAGDTFSVAYDNLKVTYSKNGVVFRTVQAFPNVVFYLDSSFASVGAAVSNITFKAMPSVVPVGGGNMLLNPSFKDGDLSHWTPDGYGITPSLYSTIGVFSGSYSLGGVETAYLYTGTGYTADGYYMQMTHDAVQIKGGKWYQFSVLVNLHRGAVVLLGVERDGAGTTTGVPGFTSNTYSSVPGPVPSSGSHEENGGYGQYWATGVETLNQGDAYFRGAASAEEHYVRLWFTFQAQPNTTNFTPYIRAFQCPTQTTTNYCFVARAMFCEVTPYTNSPVPFDMGGGAFNGAGKIGPTNIGTYISSLSVDTLYVAGNAITINQVAYNAGPVTVTALAHTPQSFTYETAIQTVTFTPAASLGATTIDVIVTAFATYSLSNAASANAELLCSVQNAASYDGSRIVDVQYIQSSAASTRLGTLIATGKFSVTANASYTFGLYAHKLNSGDTATISNVELRCEVLKR